MIGRKIIRARRQHVGFSSLNRLLLGAIFFTFINQATASALTPSLSPTLALFEKGIYGFNLDKPHQKTLTQDDFNALAATGAKVVRIILAPTWCEPCGAFELDAKNQTYASQVIAGTSARSISVIIALAPLPEGENSIYWYDDRKKASIVEIWRRLAQAYKKEPNVIAFDLINEPLPTGVPDSSKNEIWSPFALQLIGAIRQVDPKRTVVVEPAPWGLPKGLQWLKPLPVQNVVYSIHFYEPHAITHQGIYDNQRRIGYPTSSDDPIGKWDKSRLSQLLEPVRAFQLRTGAPIYIGEFSIIRWAPPDARYRYIADVLDLFDKEGWSWTYHSFREYTGWDAEVPNDVPSNLTRVPNSPVMGEIIQAIDLMKKR